jgi:hypothetical protein
MGSIAAKVTRLTLFQFSHEYFIKSKAKSVDFFSIRPNTKSDSNTSISRRFYIFYSRHLIITERTWDQYFASLSKRLLAITWNANPRVLVRHVMNIAWIYQYITSEIRLVYDGFPLASSGLISKTIKGAAGAGGGGRAGAGAGAGPSKLERGLLRAIDLLGVNHAAHIQGFLFGATYAAVFGIIVPSLQRRRSRAII